MIQSIRQLFAHRRFLGVALIFLTLSVLLTFWLIYIPHVKQQLGLSEGELGMVLFFMPVGLISAMFVSGWLNQKWGEGTVTVAGIITFAAVIPLPVVAPDFFLLAGALFLAGFASGLTDIAMNALADTLEKKYRVNIMSACHGFFSMGGIIGASIGGLILGYLSMSPVIHVASSSVLIILALWAGGIFAELQGIRAPASDQEKVFVFPKGALLGLALLAFGAMLGEGAVADWSGVYLKELVQGESGLITLGFGAFSLMMTLGRLSGDYLIMRLGRKNILIGGNATGLLGVALLLPGNPYLAILGFAFIGIGYACVIPVVFSSAADSKEVTAAAGIASVSSIGYAGFLLGPVVIGFIAEEFNLKVAWGFIAVLMLLSIFYTSFSIRKT